MITLKNGWYCCENNNRWNANTETAETAEKKSKSLINCSDCSDCSGGKNFKENPQRYTTKKIGSRNAQTTMYWVLKNTQVVCGCWCGNLQNFENRVKEKHANTKHLQPYLKEIQIMKYLIENN